MAEIEAYLDAKADAEKQASKIAQFSHDAERYLTSIRSKAPHQAVLDLPTNWPSREALLQSLMGCREAWDRMTTAWNSVPVQRRSSLPPPLKVIGRGIDYVDD
jgi:hypothetical protein